MKKLLLVLLFSIFSMFIYGQYPDYGPDIIRIRNNTTLFNTANSTTYVPSVNLTGNFNELVIVFGFPDREHTYPTLKNDLVCPQFGEFSDGQLLSAYINSHGGSISVDEWYQPAFNDYFTRQSRGQYKVNFSFPKNNGQPYLTTSSFADYIASNYGNNHSGYDTNVVYNKDINIATDIIRNIYNSNPLLFSNIKAIHLVPVGIEKYEFYMGHGGWADPSTVSIYTNGGTLIYEGPLDFQIDMHAIAHERLHIIGAISGYPSGFQGFPDRGYDVSTYDSHDNLLWNYDMMYHNGAIPEEHSLYGLPPLLSHDLIFLGWIKPEEIFTVTASNFPSVDSLCIKLVDVNDSLTTEQIDSGYRRIIKLMIKENYSGDKDEYFLIEFHKATGYDKNFTNYDEDSSGYNKGVLIWHVKEIENMININADNQIDLEVAVPYNGWYGNPVPNDSYPRDLSNRPAHFNGQHAGDFDYLDDNLMEYVTGSSLKDGGYVYRYMPDGGRNFWELSTKTVIYPWWPTDPNLPRANPTPFMRLSSQKSDFFTDETVKGHVTNRMTMGTRPSTKSWNGTIISTPIAITDIRRENDYMKLKVKYNYWEGTLTQNATWSGKVIIGNGFTLGEGVTLTVNSGTTITYTSSSPITIKGNLIANETITIPAGVTYNITPGANLLFNNYSSLVVNGALYANGTSFNEITFNFVSPGVRSNLTNGIRFSIGSEGSVSYSKIKNAYQGIMITQASPDIISNTFYNDPSVDGQYGLYIQDYSFPRILNNTISKAGNYGIRINTSSSPCFVNETFPYGNNVITQNNSGINSTWNSNPVFGTVTGDNSIYENTPRWNIISSYYCTIYANNVFWGVPPIDESKILACEGSTIYHDSPLPDNPNEGRPLAKAVFATNTSSNSISDSDADILNSLTLQLKGKYDEAILSFEKVLAKEIKNSKGIFALSKINESYEKAGKKDFIDYLNKAVRPKLSKVDELSAFVLDLESHWLLKDGKNNEAIKSIKKLKNDFKDNSNIYKFALFREGYTYLQYLKDTVNAKLSFKELELKYPEDILVHDSKILFGEDVGKSIDQMPGVNDRQLKKILPDKGIPEDYELLGNYPNPFNPATKISYALPKQSIVEIRIYNIMGNEVRSYTLNSQSAGYYNLLWDGKNSNNEQVSSGIYIYKLKAVSYQDGKVFERSAKMMMIK